METPIVDDEYTLKKFPGKGGWTYTELPHLQTNRSTPFGWMRVKGDIDGYPVKGYHLMPLGNGNLFLPVKALIRKKINKKEGDTIRVKLFADNDPVEIPLELKECFDLEPGAERKFLSLTEGQKQEWIRRISEAKKIETRVSRIMGLLKELN